MQRQRLAAVDVEFQVARQQVGAAATLAELELELVPAEVACRDCGEQSQIASRWSVRCPQCDSADVAVVRGEEFLVTSVDVT